MLGHDTIQDIKNVKNRIGTQYFNITDIIVVDVVAADVVMLLLLLLSLLLLFDTYWSLLRSSECDVRSIVCQ